MSLKKDVQDPAAARPDLAEVLAAKANTLDENRPKAIAKRAKTGHQTIRQNIERLIDKGSFQEYGQLAEPAFKSLEGPADGLVMGRALCLVAGWGLWAMTTQYMRVHSQLLITQKRIVFYIS
ncbi:MAG: hypothetical protein CM1200mP18_08680 [Gammaproteobacteria bacterium]|nr:MAG: hypothetical protein CM1200mP18_08680 [Gammaproteobacteria bacterium]